MSKYTNQRKLFDFLKESFVSQRAFTRKEMLDASGFTKSSFDTYWSKQFLPILTPVAQGSRYRVSEAFRSFMVWGKFQRHVVSQKRYVSSDYDTIRYGAVIIFDFLLPLTNEAQLRRSLDALFYRDTVRARLRSLERGRLVRCFPIGSTENEDQYLDRLVEWVSMRFGGYSISHVDGRFRAAPLLSGVDAARRVAEGERYLVDETTAVVRFIFPCGTPATRQSPLTNAHFEEMDEEESAADEEDARADAQRVRWLFGVLFVQSIVQVVNGEDEIWMVESGMRSRLHVWRVNRTDDPDIESDEELAC